MSDLVGNPNCWFSHAKAQCENRTEKVSTRQVLVMLVHNTYDTRNCRLTYRDYAKKYQSRNGQLLWVNQCLQDLPIRLGIFSLSDVLFIYSCNAKLFNNNKTLQTNM